MENFSLSPIEIELIKEVSKCDPHASILGMALHKVDTRLPQYEWKRVIKDLKNTYKDNPPMAQKVIGENASRLLESLILTPLVALSNIAKAMVDDDITAAIEILNQYADEHSIKISSNKSDRISADGQSTKSEKAA